MPSTKIWDLDLKWVNSIEVNDAEIMSKIASAKFTDKATVTKLCTLNWLVKAINCVDLSLLTGDETPESIGKLCQQAAYPLNEATEGDKSKILQLGEGGKVRCAAVCVYPLRIQDATKSLAAQGANQNVLVAAVAAGFPSGQFPLHTRLAEIYYAVALGAQEVDVVIDRSLVLRGLWTELYNELVEMRKACGNTTLKVILSVTECGSLTNVYKASVVAMLAGADFIKTSTGKEATTMTMHEGLVMCRAINDFLKRKGVKVGLKPAGGVRTSEQAVSWLLMMKQEVGDEWVDPKLFRIGSSGASALLANVANAILKC